MTIQPCSAFMYLGEEEDNEGWGGGQGRVVWRESESEGKREMAIDGKRVGLNVQQQGNRLVKIRQQGSSTAPH